MTDTIHYLVRKYLDKPSDSKCPKCGSIEELDLCNVSPQYNPNTYTEDLKNWYYACRKCHMNSDGRLSNIIDRNRARRGIHIANVEHRQCHGCGCYDTYISPSSGMHVTSRSVWRHLPNDKEHWYCHNCYHRNYQKHRKKEIREYLRIWRQNRKRESEQIS